MKCKWDCTNWDLNTQQPHGGQEWATMDNFVEDFSVTTNTLGPPWKAVAAATAALSDVEYTFRFYVCIFYTQSGKRFTKVHCKIKN